MRYRSWVVLAVVGCNTKVPVVPFDSLVIIVFAVSKKKGRKNKIKESVTRD